MKTETELKTGSIQMGKMKREGNEERVLYFYIWTSIIWIISVRFMLVWQRNSKLNFYPDCLRLQSQILLWPEQIFWPLYLGINISHLFFNFITFYIPIYSLYFTFLLGGGLNHINLLSYVSFSKVTFCKTSCQFQ